MSFSATKSAETNRSKSVIPYRTTFKDSYSKPSKKSPIDEDPNDFLISPETANKNLI